MSSNPDVADDSLGEMPDETSSQAETSLDSPSDRPSRPLRIFFLFPAGLLLAVLVILAIALLGREVLRPFVVLDAANPVYTHPDGLTVSLASPDSRARVSIETIPRETFLTRQAGNAWSEALDVLPEYATPLSPLYTLEVRSGGPVVAEMAIPNGAEPLARLDLYIWDRAEKKWVFMPSHLDEAHDGIVFQPDRASITVMAVHVVSLPPVVGVVVTQGSPDAGLTYELAIPEGVSVTASGELIGAPAQASAPVVMPLVKNQPGGITSYEDAGQQVILIEQLMSLLQPYDGLVLDFAPGPGYSQLVAALAERIHAHGKRLDIVARGDSADAYELRELSLYADRVWIAPGDDPNIYLPTGDVRDLLSDIIRQVDRTRVGLLVSELNVDIAGGMVSPITTQNALALFGDVAVSGQFDPSIPLDSGTSLPLRLTGQIESMGFDVPLGMNYFTYRDQAGVLHYIYFGSAQNLARKLAWANHYGLGAVAVHGLAHPDAPAHLVDGVTAFTSQQPVGNPPALQIVWRVQSASGASVAETAGDLTLIQYLWQVLVEPGQYMISAAIREGEVQSERGQVSVQVAQGIPSGTPTPTATPSLAPTADPNATPAPRPTTAPVSGSIVAGQFELGGQTQTFAHPDQMRRAGMSWVKFQHKWSPGDDPSGAVGGRINDAHAQGFKVLLSIPGPSNPSSIDFQAYVSFVSRVAALGPDAIEIWNEMNFSYEWPPGQIDGAVYVNNMLAPAYQAIKAVNPSVMVISGAPTPTGAFNGCGTIGTISGCDDWFYIQQMRDAGANNYLDCVGVHYNEGIIPPSQRTGDPRAFGDFYSRYFFGMLDLYYGTFGKPLCFTELGYLTPEGYGALPANFAWAQSTTVAQQAQWLAEAAVLASQSNKVRLLIIFNVDFTTYGADPQAGYAMIRPGGGCPACDALAAVAP